MRYLLKSRSSAFLLTIMMLTIFSQPALAVRHGKTLSNLIINDIMFAQMMLPLVISRNYLIHIFPYSFIASQGTSYVFNICNLLKLSPIYVEHM